MKKRIVAFIAILMIVLSAIITCKKDDFKELIGTCPPVKIEFTVQLSSNPVLGGTTIGAGTFLQNTALVVSATPNTGYTFVNWTEGATILTTSSSYNFTLNSNKVFIANFAAVIPGNLTVTTSSSPLLGGTTLGGGAFAPNTDVTLTAAPNTGYAFVNWTNGATIVSTSLNYTFTLTKDIAFVANFTPVVAGNFAITLTSNPSAGGTTSGSGSFTSGSVTIGATPNANYTFVNWTKGTTIIATTPSYTFTLTKDTAFVANFIPVVVGKFAVTLTSNPSAGGTTTGAGSFAPNTVVALNATPNANYTFVNWTKGTTVVSTTAAFTFTLTKDTAFVANFTPVVAGKFNVTLSSNPTAGGTTTGDGSFNLNTVVALTATANVGYTFVNWTQKAVVASTTSAFTFTLTKDTAFVANFILKTGFTLNVTAVNGTVAKNPDKLTYDSGTSVILTPTPATGYKFDSWTGDASGNANPLTVLMNANKNVTANFILIPTGFTLNVTAVNGSVVKNPDKSSYNSGDIVQLTATPGVGYTFDSWSGDATGTVNTASVTMNGNKNVTANFIPVTTGNCPATIDLGSAGNFTIFAESGISTTGVTKVTGDMGVNPITSTAITGFGLILPAGGASSTSSLVVGKVYAPDYAPPTPANMVTTSSDMHTAYTTANGLVTPAPVNEYMAGNLNGQTLHTGIYKWSTGVSITNSITLDGGGRSDCAFIFQIAQDLTVANGAKIILQNGAQAKNIFWVVAGSGAVLGTSVDFSGNILCKTLISVNTGGKVVGRLLAQTAVTLNAATITKP